MQYIGVVVLVLVCVVIIYLIVDKMRQRTIQKNLKDDVSSPVIGQAHLEFDDGVIAVYKPKSEKEMSSADTAREHHGIVALHVIAKDGKVFAGYELLQILLSLGLRFGEMNIFHYHRDANVQQDVLFSLISATEPGVFDLLNMGAFSCKGLTLFMRKVEDVQDNNMRYELMLKTASHLSEDLDALLLDGNKRLVSLSSSI